MTKIFFFSLIKFIIFYHNHIIFINAKLFLQIIIGIAFHQIIKSPVLTV